MADWDRNRDWVVHRTRWKRTSLLLSFAGGGPTARELQALRAVVSELREQPPAEILDAIGPTGVLCLDDRAASEADRIASELQRAGLRVRVEDASYDGYLPVDRASGDAWLIEDDAEAKRIGLEMLEAGFPVVESEDE